jgi:hypothetical protein
MYQSFVWDLRVRTDCHFLYLRISVFQRWWNVIYFSLSATFGSFLGLTGWWMTIEHWNTPSVVDREKYRISFVCHFLLSRWWFESSFSLMSEIPSLFKVWTSTCQQLQRHSREDVRRVHAGEGQSRWILSVSIHLPISSPYSNHIIPENQLSLTLLGSFKDYDGPSHNSVNWFQGCNDPRKSWNICSWSVQSQWSRFSVDPQKFWV